MANISELLKNGGDVMVVIRLADLAEYSEELLSKAKREEAKKEEELYTATEFAKKHNRDRSAVYRWVEKGVLKPYMVGDKKYYRECDLKKGLDD